MTAISQIASIKSNINSFGGTVVSLNTFNGIREKVSSTNLGGFGDNSIEKFYKDLSELNQYKDSKIVLGVTKIIAEYLNKFMSNSLSLVSITEGGESIPEESDINKMFNNINFRKRLTDKLFDYIYFGSELFLLKFSKDKTIGDEIPEVVDLKYPFSSILHKHDDSVDYYVNGEIVKLVGDDFYYIPLRIGKLDLQLDEKVGVDFNKSPLVSNDSWVASRPLFHGLVTDLKLHILKDVLTQLIQIQDIVAPNLLLANVDKNTSEEKAIELSENIEKLINQYGDLTQLIASTADITTLSQFILNNVRVYPDLLGVIRGTEKFDFTRLSGKNNEIRNELENTEQQLVNAVGIPIELYKGQSSNKYDALKQSDRLLSKIQSELDTISDSITEFVINYLTSIGKYKSSLEIKCNLFDDSFLSGINSTYKYETSTQYMSHLTELANMIKDTILNTSDVFDIEKLSSYLLNEAELIYPGFSKLIKPDFVKELINKKKSEISDESEESDEL